MALLCSIPAWGREILLLDDLDVSKVAQGIDMPRDVGPRAEISIGHCRFAGGLHTRTDSRLYIQMDGSVEAFTAMVGVDDRNEGEGSLEFFVIDAGGADKILWQSGPMKKGDPPKQIAPLGLRGVMELLLKVTGPGHQHASWADAEFSYMGKPPRTLFPPEERHVDRIAKQALEPRINGAMAVGIRPNTPLVYALAVTGEKPMTLAVEGLPEGLSYNAETRVISGEVARAGDYKVALSAENGRGKAKRTLTFRVGEKMLAQTPPMGYLAWNVIQGLAACRT